MKRETWWAKDWPRLPYDLVSLEDELMAVFRSQGMLFGRMAGMEVVLRDKFSLDALAEEVLKSCDIEGIRLPPDAVRATIRSHLGIEKGVPAVDAQTADIVDVILDATANAHMPLTEQRLFEWHAAVFPATIDSQPPEVVKELCEPFVVWINSASADLPIVKAGLAHLWFMTMRPFDDGNGWMARAICDLMLARGDGSPQRCYSLSAQLHRERPEYFRMLEGAQTGKISVTQWLAWYLGVLKRAVDSSYDALCSTRPFVMPAAGSFH